MVRLVDDTLKPACYNEAAKASGLSMNQIKVCSGSAPPARLVAIQCLLHNACNTYCTVIITKAFRSRLVTQACDGYYC